MGDLQGYLAKRKKTYDATGDFVTEALATPKLADAKPWPEFESHLTGKHDSFNTSDAAKTVWRAYTDAERKSSVGSG